MVEKIKAYRSADGSEFVTKAEAEKHEARAELGEWFVAKGACDGDRNLIKAIVESILADPGTFLAILRKAGIKSGRGRGPDAAPRSRKTPPAEKATKAAAE